jgi:hypothetical protein
MRLPKLTSRWGLSLLGAWRIAMAVVQLVPKLAFSGNEVLLAVLAGLAGVLVLLDR